MQTNIVNKRRVNLSTFSDVRRSKTKRTSKEFGFAVGQLMAERRSTFTTLSDATKILDATGSGLSRTYLSQVVTGQHVPTPARMELIAAALRVDPTYFKEYRQYVAAQRAKLLTAEIGLDEVLAALDELEARQSGNNPPADN